MAAVTINAAWAAPVRALTDGARPLPARRATRPSGATKTVASLLDHEVVRKTWSATAKADWRDLRHDYRAAHRDFPPQISRQAGGRVCGASGRRPAAGRGGKATGTNGREEDARNNRVEAAAEAGRRSVGRLARRDRHLARRFARQMGDARNGTCMRRRRAERQVQQFRLPSVGFSEYDLSLAISRPKNATNVKSGLWLAIVVDDHYQAAVLMDATWKDTVRRWGLERIDNKPPQENGTQVTDKPVLTTTASHVLVKVRRGSVNVTCNDIPILNWRGSGEQLSLPKGAGVQGRPALYLATHAEFSFSEIRVTPGGADWTPLFNDRDLKDSTGADLKVWRVDAKNGVLAGTATHSNWLYTQRDYGDFRLRLEFQMAASTNSGVCLRGSPNDNEKDNLQIELCNDLALTKGTPTGAEQSSI